MLNDENYPVWSYKMELMLIEDNLWDVLQHYKPTATEVAKLAAWTKNNDKVRARIGLLVDDDRLVHIRNFKTAKEV